MNLKPLKALDDRPSAMRDSAKGGYSLTALEALVDTMQGQYDWRARSDKACRMYDMGKQMTVEQERKIRVEWGIEPRQVNLIHGVVNGVLGQEAKARSDVKIEADEDEFADVADVFSLKLKEAQRESNIDMAVSNAYASQVKAGIGWVEVSRASDPLDYPYRVKDIHRNEIWYDDRDLDVGLDACRWLVRKRWQDLDDAVALMPEHEEVLKSAVNGWDLFNLPEDESSTLRQSYNNERRTTILRDEWCDGMRKRIKFYEVWYRVPATCAVLHLGPTRKVIYDPDNPMHIEAVSRGRVQVTKSITRQVRMALFAGPHRLVDVGTTRRHFPYVPFWAFRDDEDDSPYGMIEGMISPQEEYTERRQMFNWMLLARQVTVDNDALDLKANSLRDLESQVMRRDLMVVLNANRKNAQGFKIANDLDLQKGQYEAMQDAKQLVQDVPRVYGSQLGNAPAGVTSGIANSLLIEQGMTVMGELNDNYRFGRRRVHEQVLDLMVEDHAQENMQIVMGSGQKRRVVVLNTFDPQSGMPMNRVQDAPVKVGMSDIPSSPAFRMQEQQQVAQIMQALGNSPQALAILAPAYIEGSSLPNRQALADDLRRATGIPVAGDLKAQQAAQQQQQQQAIEAMELDKAEKAGKVEKLAAETRLLHAKADDHEDSGYIAARQQGLAELQPDAANEDRLISDAMSEALA
jgi:hypothetical protein